MLREIAAARAATLREWAEDIQKEALEGAEGYGEIVMLLRRTALKIELAVGIGPQAASSLSEVPVSEPAEAAELREG